MGRNYEADFIASVRSKEEEKVIDFFARVARKDKFFTEAERQLEGVKTFKRKVLGLCGYQSIKTLDEMAQTLYSTGVASSVDEGREITPLLMGSKVRYGVSGQVGFEEIIDGQGNKKYRIFVLKYS